MATLFDENSNMTALAALNGVTAGPSTAATTANLVNSNTLVNQLLSTKDSRWLQIEVCREYQRGQCSRTEQECKYAHPPAHVDVQNGRVTACYDSIKVGAALPNLQAFRAVAPERTPSANTCTRPNT